MLVKSSTEGNISVEWNKGTSCFIVEFETLLVKVSCLLTYDELGLMMHAFKNETKKYEEFLKNACLAIKPLSDIENCYITGKLCGTDTWPSGFSCECLPCQRWVKRKQSTFEFDK